MTRVLPGLAGVFAMAIAFPAMAQHEGHGTHGAHESAPPDEPEPAEIDHAAMGHAPPAPPRTPIPPVTDADRAAAFPDLAGHAVHDTAVHSFVLLDQLELRDPGDAHDAFAWEASAWIGNDIDRLWIRSDGEAPGMAIESASLEVFYGRAIARWWDAVAGVRHDFGEGPSRTWAAFGVMGVAPGKFEVEATAYVGDSGDTAAVLEAEYDTLLTNRLVLQWLAGVEVRGRDDAAHGIGSGLSTLEAGVRLRYEFTRRFAPYVGVARERAHGGTAAFRRAAGEDVGSTELVVGIRTWF